MNPWAFIGLHASLTWEAAFYSDVASDTREHIARMVPGSAWHEYRAADETAYALQCEGRACAFRESARRLAESCGVAS